MEGGREVGEREKEKFEKRSERRGGEGTDVKSVCALGERERKFKTN